VARVASGGRVLSILTALVAGLVVTSLIPSVSDGGTGGLPVSPSLTPQLAPHGPPSVGNNSTWTPLNVTNAPAARWLPAITYDPATQSVLLFGGSSGPALPSATWSFANYTWTNISATTGPSPPDLAAMVYDTALGAVVGYGDVSGYAVTFEFANGTWTNVTHAGGPPGRTRVMMTYDVADSAVLLFGGDNGNGTQSFNDTWEFTASGWTQLNPPQAPSARARGMLTWDPQLNAAILYGGFPVYGQPDFNDTWEFARGTWTPMNLSSAPSPRDGSLFVYDPNVDAIVLFGGFYTLESHSQGVDNDTWYFNGTWSQTQPAVSPSARAMPGAVFDPELNAIYSFGGYGFPTALADSWAWDENLTITAIAPNVPVGEVGTPVQFSTSIHGGLGPFAVAWTFGDGTNGSGLVVSHAYATTGSFPVLVGVSDATNFTAGWEITYWVNGSALEIGPVTATAREAWPGLSVGFAVNVTEGVTPYNLTWTFGDGGIAYGPAPTHIFASMGTATVNVTVRDAAGASLQGTLSLPVAGAALSAGTPTVSGTLVVGSAAHFNVTATGGISPYNLTWTFGDGTTGYGPAPGHVYAKSGSYVVDVTVRDQYGLEANASVTVTVLPASAPPSPGPGTSSSPFGIPWWAWVVVGAVVVVGIGSGILYLRKRPATPPPAAPPTGPES
jgi:hypothetical protein